MAATRFALNIPSTSLSAGVAKTIAMVTAPTNQRVKLLGVAVSFDGQSTTAQPVQIRIYRATTAGTFTAATPVPLEKDLSGTIQSTGGTNATVEPTVGDVLRTVTVHPQTGYEVFFPFGQEVMIQGGGRIGVEINAPAAVAARGVMTCEE